MEDNKERFWSIIYICIIVFQIIVNIFGNIYISINSKEQKNIVIASAEEYKKVGFDKSLEITQIELKNVAENAISFIHNLLIEQYALLVISFLCFIPCALRRYIEKEVCREYQMLEILCIIFTIISVIYNVKGVFDLIGTQNQACEYYRNIFQILGKLMETL